MRVQPDGRAADCAQAFTLKAPPGISVVLGAYPESVARRAFVLRDSAASPAARESWFDPALVCAGPDVAGGTTCSWGPGQEEVIFVPLPATRGVLVNIPEPRALETYYFAYWAEPPWASGEFVESLPAPGYSIHVSHCLARPLRIFQLAEFSEPAPRLEAVEFLSTSTCNFRVNDFVGAWPYRLEPRDECERSVLWGRCNVCRDQRAVNRGRAERNSLRLRASVHDRGGPDASRLMVRERDGLPRPGPRADRVV